MSQFLPEKTFWVVSISWWCPHTDPPSGIRHLWACCIPSPHDSQGVSSHIILRNLIENHAPQVRPGCGYTISLDVMQDIKPARRWSASAKAKNRKRLMVQRANKKDPLFADWVINQKIASDPDYFDADKIDSQSELHRKMMAERHAQYERRFIETSIVSANDDQIHKIKEIFNVRSKKF